MDEFLGVLGQQFDVFVAWLYNPTTQLLFAPLLAMVLIMATPVKRERLIKTWAVLGAGLSALAAVLMATGLPAGLRAIPMFAQYLPFRPEAGMQFRQDFTWLSIKVSEQLSYAVNYSVGVDGLSLPLIIMGALVILLAVIWALPRTRRVRDFYVLVLLMEVGLLGVFVALDYVFYYLFWELMLIPMYFLIAAWGKDPERAGRAAIKFFIFTLAGSVFMLISFITMQVLSGEYSFDILKIAESARSGNLSLVLPQWRLLMFLGLLFGFAVKVPMFPLHTWLPDAHTEAPTEMSVVLAAVMLKTGTYAYLRILYPTFPDVAYSVGPLIAFCGMVAIVYGAAITLVQTDIKRLVAYSSISHMGFIVLGISAQNPDGTAGAVFQMVAHGVIISALFFLCGVIERRYGTRDLRKLAAMWQLAPSYAAVLGLAAFAGMGLPGLAGFWGEFLVLKGAFFNNPTWQTVHVGGIDGSRFLQIMAVLAVIGVLTAAVYMINLLQRVLPGEAPAGLTPWRGMRLTDALALWPLAAAIVLLGLFPAPVLHMCLDFANQLGIMQLQF